MANQSPSPTPTRIEDDDYEIYTMTSIGGTDLVNLTNDPASPSSQTRMTDNTALDERPDLAADIAEGVGMAIA